MFRVGHIINETYRIERLLGQGGTAAVFLVSHVRMPRQFALKVITGAHCSPEFLQRFRQEAEILAAIVHPHLVSVVDWNQTPDGKPYLVMEQLVGSDLAQFLRRIGPLSPELALQIFVQVGLALQTAHDNGIVHRDLKPANIFLCSNGPFPYFAKVLDFGIAKSVRLPSALQTDRSVMMGTPAYMAPEQVRNDGEQVDERTDQFALAAVLYEMIAGRPAFYRAGDHLVETIMRVLTEDPEPLQEPRIDAAIRRAMSKQRSQRFASLTEFIAATGAHELSTAMAVLDRTARVAARPPPTEPEAEPVPPKAMESLAIQEEVQAEAVLPSLVATVPPVAKQRTLKAPRQLLSPRLLQWGGAAAMVSLILTGAIFDCGGDNARAVRDAGSEAGPWQGAAVADGRPRAGKDEFGSLENESEEVPDFSLSSSADLVDRAADTPPSPRAVDLGVGRRGHLPHCCEFTVYGDDSIGSEVKDGILGCFSRARPLLSRSRIFKGKVRLGRNRQGLVVVSEWVPDQVSTSISSCLEGLKVEHDSLPQNATVSVQESR